MCCIGICIGIYCSSLDIDRIEWEAITFCVLWVMHSIYNSSVLLGHLLEIFMGIEQPLLDMFDIARESIIPFWMIQEPLKRQPIPLSEYF